MKKSLKHNRLYCFFKNVQVSKTCWIWTGQRNRSKFNKLSYGRIHSGKDKVLVHRFSWTIFRGKIPKGLCVLHKCDNGLCVNPLHLFLGTLADNNRDRENKCRGNHARGERVGGSKLKADDVIEIRNLSSQGFSRKQLGDRFGVNKGTIGHILEGNTWKHIPWVLTRERAILSPLGRVSFEEIVE